MFQTLFFVTSLAVPLLAIMWLYMNMLLRLWRGSAAAHGPGPARDRANRGRGQVRSGIEFNTLPRKGINLNTRKVRS